MASPTEGQKRVPHDAKQPPVKVRARCKPAERLERLNERFLNQVLCIVPVAAQSVCDPIEDIPVGMYQALEPQSVFIPAQFENRKHAANPG